MPTENPFGVVRNARDENRRSVQDTAARIQFLKAKEKRVGIRGMTMAECRELDAHAKAHPAAATGLNLGALLRRAGV